MSHIDYDAPPINGIELIPGTSPEFEDILRLATDAESISSIQAIFPYSVIVKNNTDERLIAVTVRFYLTDPNGRTVWHQMTVGTRSNRPSNMIAPGEAALVTPETGLNAVLRAGVRKHATDTSMLNARLSRHTDLYSHQAQVRITVDSVVFEDGGVVGSDKARMTEMLNAWAAAEDSITDKLLAQQVPSVDGYLTSLRNAPTPASSSLEDVDHFEKHLHDFAEDLLSQMKSFRSEDEFFAYLRSKRLSRIPTLKRRGK